MRVRVGRRPGAYLVGMPGAWADVSTWADLGADPYLHTCQDTQMTGRISPLGAYFLGHTD